VQTWRRLDVGSTGDDYSGDVVARAQYLICQEGWTFCGEVCPPTVGSIPTQNLLLEHYPSPSQFSDKVLHDMLNTDSAAADALRISYMLNQIPSHRVDHRETASRDAENGRTE